MATDVVNVHGLGLNMMSKATDGTANEQLALISIANRLGSIILNDELGIAEEKDVHQEAKLLMSLSCSSPTNAPDNSGRTTPESDASSCYSAKSASSAFRRDSFTFICPSLSLETPFQDVYSGNGNEQKEKPPPSVLLGRILKVEDQDALRLSAEAMARNIMQTYHKAIQWRTQTWVDQLSVALLEMEKDLKDRSASEEQLKELLDSGEAKLLLQLRELNDSIAVIDARTSFKVLPQRVTKLDSLEPSSKKQRLESSDDESADFKETEYKYNVIHVLTMEAYVNVVTPAGYVQIDLQVPGTIEGTFLSLEPGVEKLTAVLVKINTDILASMIEKSCRIVVRSSAEALLCSEPNAPPPQPYPGTQVDEVVDSPSIDSFVPTCTPKRKYSDERVSGLVVVTPRDVSSPSSCEDSDTEEKPVLLSIPDSFSDSKPISTLRMVSPQPSRPGDVGGITFTSQAANKQEIPLPTLVSPHQSSKPSFECVKPRGKGPYLPVLVEVACAAMRAH